MSFDYEKIKAKQESGEQWASYSDLFMVLSMVFLLLYVTASLRTGTESLYQQMENRRLQERAQDLEDQIKVYNSLRENYIETQASMQEQEVYERLMDRLNLLQEENRDEAKRLRALAQENEEKEMALNEYQQIIRNIINANVLSKSRIERRDQRIQDREVTIQNQLETIAQRERVISDQAETIEDKERQISEKELEIERLDLEVLRKEQTIDMKMVEIEQKQIELMTKQEQIDGLNQDIANKENIISQNKQEINRISSNLNAKMEDLEAQRRNNEITRQEYEAQIQTVRQRSNDEIQEINKMNQNLYSQLEDAQKEIGMANRQIKEANKMLEGQMALKEQLNSELQGMQSEILASRQQFEEEKLRFQQEIQGLEVERDTLSQDLSEAQELLNARREIAERIIENFQKEGIQAQVDERTGEVVLDFGDSFFDTGSDELKPEMKERLREFMPIYAESLLSDPEVADRIESVDIIGFASPTFAGRYINPSSIDPRDRQAIRYNTDLSINRARSVFNYIIDTDKISYNRQQDIQALLKVSGRSFFSGALEGRAPAKEMSQSEFCELYNCKQEQRVIIRFDLAN